MRRWKWNPRIWENEAVRKIGGKHFKCGQMVLFVGVGEERIHSAGWRHKSSSAFWVHMDIPLVRHGLLSLPCTFEAKQILQIELWIQYAMKISSVGISACEFLWYTDWLHSGTCIFLLGFLFPTQNREYNYANLFCIVRHVMWGHWCTFSSLMALKQYGLCMVIPL